MFKWISWGIRLLATAVLLSFLCIWTTGYIVNSYMESIIKQLELPLETKPFALSGIWGTLWGVDSTPVKEAGEEAKETKAIATNSDIGSDDPDKSAEQATVTSPAQNASNGLSNPHDETSDAGEDGASPSPSPSTPDQDQQQANNGETQPEEAVPAVSGNTGTGDHQMTDAERQALYANVVSKLDASQLELLSEALEGGVSAEKLAKLKEMLKTALTEDEYAQMMETLQGATNVD